MTSDEFLEWAMTQPRRYELEAGEVVAMAPERVSHTRVKGLIYRRLDDAIRTAGLACEAFVDGVSVEIDEDTVYEPDALVRCGPPLEGDPVKISDPLVVVEVVSPGSQGQDCGEKLEGYFRLPSVRHYLVVKTRNQTVIHHMRDEFGRITTRIIRGGPITLDPRGVTLSDFFPPS
ncbi:MAG: Uma2 family endonuclease [Acetobacteraceae bacterium]|nr:Uma2 family endonuclease [Acetobacteraceae bacterium]